MHLGHFILAGSPECSNEHVRGQPTQARAVHNQASYLVQEREDILKLHARGLPLGPDVDLASIASSCHGYSGADLAAVCREAAMRAISEAVKDASAGQGPAILPGEALNALQIANRMHCT